MPGVGPLTGVLVPRPQVVGGGDDDEPHEAGEEVEERVAAVVVLELLPRHDRAGRPSPPPLPPAAPGVAAPGSREIAGSLARPPLPRPRKETCHCSATIARVASPTCPPRDPRPAADWLGPKPRPAGSTKSRDLGSRDRGVGRPGVGRLWVSDLTSMLKQGCLRARATESRVR